MNDDTVLSGVRRYYGEVLTSNADLKTTACCCDEALPAHVQAVLDEIEPEVLARFYGCGSPLPEALEGLTVLDLGCGAGRDVFVAARLVGPNGRVIGVDMTAGQLDVARRNLDAQMARFGYPAPNVELHEGRIEDLAAVGMDDASVDLVISNCVINLSPDKARVFDEIHRVLRPGGELYFADVFADRRIPARLTDDPVLRGECLGGALYSEDFRRLMERVGFLDHRTVASRPLSLDDQAIERAVGMVGFHSRTVRAFKLDGLEDRCEDYGQVAIYRGSVAHSPHRLVLDDHHVFPAGKPIPVCGNTAAMLAGTRFAAHFDIIGDTRVHHGLFPCAPADPDGGAAGCGC